jgi:hypothetical protein
MIHYELAEDIGEEIIRFIAQGGENVIQRAIWRSPTQYRSGGVYYGYVCHPKAQEYQTFYKKTCRAREDRPIA